MRGIRPCALSADDLKGLVAALADESARERGGGGGGARGGGARGAKEREEEEQNVERVYAGRHLRGACTLASYGVHDLSTLVYLVRCAPHTCTSRSTPSVAIAESLDYTVSKSSEPSSN